MATDVTVKTDGRSGEVRSRRCGGLLVGTAVTALVWSSLLLLCGGPAAASSPCWDRVLQSVANLEDAPPDGTLVVLFGGSRAREATVGDADWTRQLRTVSGERLFGRNLASTNQTFGEDLALAKHLPASTVVLIGVDEGRFTKPVESRPVRLPAPGAAPDESAQHRYSITKVRTTANKEMLADRWLQRRLPVFEDNAGANASELEALVSTCAERGLHPVLVATPWNTDVIGDAFDGPRRTWTAACERIAADYGIPFLDFSTDVGLADGDFYDLFHLVEPGREKWQARLSEEVVAVVEELRQDATADVSATGAEGAAVGIEDSPFGVGSIGLGAVAHVGWGFGTGTYCRRLPTVAPLIPARGDADAHTGVRRIPQVGRLAAAGLLDDPAMTTRHDA